MWKGTVHIMKNEISLNEIIREVQRSKFVSCCAMPLGYKPALPVLKILNSKLCLVIPFVRYKITGEVDKTQVFPIKYTVTVLLPEAKPIAFEDFTYKPEFKDVSFGEPIGLFRHDSIKQFSKYEYAQKREELFGMYEKIIASLIYGENYTQEDDAEFSKLLNIMLEPSLKPFYEAIDSDFYNKYII